MIKLETAELANNNGLLTISNTGPGGIKIGSAANQHITASGNISASGKINAQAMGIDADQFYRAGGVAALNYDSTTGGGRIEVGSANKPALYILSLIINTISLVTGLPI